MGEIVNLRRVRRQQARAAAKRQAAENRALHGQSKATRDAAAASGELEQRRLDNARLPSGGDGEPGE